MGKPFYERLKDYYSEVSTVLRGEANAASIFPNTTDIGMSRERVYKEVLRLHLPSSCNVSYGGFLFDQEGNESKQIDLLITDESALQFNFHNKDKSGKSFACIDGCIAVVSIKSNLDSQQLIDSLKNIASIPNKQPLGKRINPLLPVPEHEFNDWPYKIIYASDGVGLDTIIKMLTNFYQENPEIPIYKRPNLIHVVSKYVIIRIKEGGAKTRDGTKLVEHTFYSLPDPTDVFGLLYASIEIQKIARCSKHILYIYDSLIDKISF